MATSKGFGQFGKRMKIVSKNFGGNVEKTIRRAALAADTAAVLTTPIDTGRARGNWVVSIGQPVEVVKGQPGSPQAGEAEALAQGQSAVASYRLGAGSIFISNSLPYIVKLDEGSSSQATAGMSKFAIQAARQQFRKPRTLGRR